MDYVPAFLVPLCVDDEEEQELSARVIDGMRTTSYTDVAAANGDAGRGNGGGWHSSATAPAATHARSKAAHPYVHYYETKSSLAARATRAESDCNVASPRRRMPANPRVGVRTRLRVVSWHELDAHYSWRPCGACDRHAASRKSTIAHHEVKTPPPTSAPTPDPQIHGVASRNQRGAFPHRPVARCGRRHDVPDSSGARTLPEPARKMLASARPP
ncbi:hypothetical protein B0H15DRAFT_1021570 [Mycena belliarum]|uniref:Uncharacterized protein n=1 Tax=Mycena belliarum TaxID=1033014 RepID=A0AAD6U608_9AGAR|nr:hypothetical protein B0H15DRAFT_1021570 [Mycena belliae]